MKSVWLFAFVAIILSLLLVVSAQNPNVDFVEDDEDRRNEVEASGFSNYYNVVRNNDDDEATTGLYDDIYVDDGGEIIVDSSDASTLTLFGLPALVGLFV